MKAGNLRHTFQGGGFDNGIAKFMKFCNIVLVISTLLCGVSIFITPLAFNVSYEEYPVIVYCIIFIFLGSFYICLYGALPAIILVLILYYLHKKYRSEKLDIAFTQKIVIKLIIAVTIFIATAAIMLGFTSR